MYIVLCSSFSSNFIYMCHLHLALLCLNFKVFFLAWVFLECAYLKEYFCWVFFWIDSYCLSASWGCCAILLSPCFHCCFWDLLLPSFFESNLTVLSNWFENLLPLVFFSFKVKYVDFFTFILNLIISVFHHF